jgi:hypothetical protein
LPEKLMIFAKEWYACSFMLAFAYLLRSLECEVSHLYSRQTNLYVFV